MSKLFTFSVTPSWKYWFVWLTSCCCTVRNSLLIVFFYIGKVIFYLLSQGRHTLTFFFSPMFQRISDMQFHKAYICSDSLGFRSLSKGIDFSFGRFSKTKCLIKYAWTTDCKPLVAFFGHLSPKVYPVLQNVKPVRVHSPLGGDEALPKTKMN